MSRVTLIPSDRRLRIVVLAVVVGVAAALTVASASLALKSQRRNTLAARQAAIVPLPPLAVFNRAQTAAERAAPASNPRVRAILDSLPATDPSTLRFALVGVGPDKRTAFVVRGRDGRTCSGLTGFTSGCLDGLPSDMPAEITYGGETATAGPVVWGVVWNDVRAIDVVVGGQASPAVLGHNAYFFQAPAGKTSQDLQVLRVHMADGTVTTEAIG